MKKKTSVRIKGMICLFVAIYIAIVANGGERWPQIDPEKTVGFMREYVLSAPDSAPAKGNTVEITETPVNIRSGAGKKNAVVARTVQGKTYKVLSVKKDSDGIEWCGISLDRGKTGWVMKRFCRVVEKSASTTQKTTSTAKKTAASTAKKTTRKTASTTAESSGKKVMITATPVNIRSEAGKNHSVVARTSKGKTFELLSVKKDRYGNEWCCISLDGGKTGWVLKSCCRITGKTSSTAEKTAKKSTTTTAKKTNKKTTQKTTKKTTTTTVNSGESKVEITATPVNIRLGAGRENAVVASTSKGKTYRLLSNQKDRYGNEWFRISLGAGKSGWILKSCCRVIGKTTSTTAKTTATTKKTTTSFDETAFVKSIQPTDREAKYFIVVYKGSQSTVIYGKDKNGDYTKQIRIFTCSTGKKSSPTRTGSYRIRAKYRWRALVGGVYGQYSSSISGDYLFHSVPYTRQDASTLENGEYDKLGKPASKGCVRLCVRDSKWIYDNCPIGTRVKIVDRSGPQGPGVPSRKSADRYSGWDPSDKWASGNPYFPV